MGKVKKKNKTKNSPRHTPLSKHQRNRSVFIPQLADTNISFSEWDRNWLPEYLWVASLREIVPIDEIYKPYYAFLDAVDNVLDPSEPLLGLITDFGHLQDDQDRLLQMHADLVEELFLEPFGRILAFFPESPASWLISESFLSKGGHLDPDIEIPKLRSLVADLMDGRGELATAVRMASFGRIIKKGKMMFPKGLPTLDLLPKYPAGLTDDEKRLCESFVRASLGPYLNLNDRYYDHQWSKYFWRQNYNLSLCRPIRLPLRGGRAVTQDEFAKVTKIIEENSKRVRRYLDSLALQIQYDLYAPEHGAVLHGLFARCVRFYLLVMEDPNMWARDTAGIMLRCLVETAITFCYLAEKGTDEEFEAFRKYGEGQKKLLMLQLQDNHPDAQTLEGKDVEDLSKELGGFTAELLQIDLGHWAKKDARKLASAVGLERFYRLVYAPTSADVHGTWTSLQDSNLGVCAEPLHRFHYVPSYSEPPLYVSTLAAVQEILEHVRDVAVKLLGFPANLEMTPLPDSPKE